MCIPINLPLYAYSVARIAHYLIQKKQPTKFNF